MNQQHSHQRVTVLAIAACLILSLPSQAAEKEITLDLGDGANMELVLIPTGSFMMGDADGQPDEKPVHKVTITRPFYLGKYHVTQRQWLALMVSNPSDFKGAQLPVENVLWEDVRVFLRKLDAKFVATGMRFDLPTEAQWEYACRAGGTTKFSFGDTESQLTDYGWFKDNAGGQTHPVGQKRPNAWGLYDMHGNVCQWCSDWYVNNYYQRSPAADPTGAEFSYHHVTRGGCLDDPASRCRTAYRNMNDPADRNHDVGFRVIAIIPSSERPSAPPDSAPR
jgi:formylglycine-generating enzyme required for sulfatase activity